MGEADEVSRDRISETLLVSHAELQIRLARYDRWFKEIAEKIGIELKP